MHDPMRRWSWKTGPLVALVLLGFQVGLFLPQLIDGGLLLPLSPWLAPPWTRADWVTAPQDFEGSDKVTYNLPNLYRWRAALEEDPSALLWNPGNWGGIAYCATQNTHSLYPPMLVFRWCDPARGLLWWAIFHGWLASFLSFWVLRRGASDGGALVGAALLGGGGWFLVHHDMIQYVHAAAWLPLVYSGVWRCVHQKGVLGPALIALGTALSLLGGMPQVTMLGLFVAGPLTVALVAPLGVRRAVLGGGRALLGVILGLLLAGPQLLATAEIAGTSARSRLSPEHIQSLGASPAELLETLFPGVLGHSPAEQRFANAQTPEEGALFRTQLASGPPLATLAGGQGIGHGFPERVHYVGAAGVALALLGLWGRPRGLAIIGLILVAAGWAVVMKGPVLTALSHQPFFQIANPRRWILLVAMGLPLLAAVGFDRIRGARAGSLWLIFWVLVSAATAITVAPQLLTGAARVPSDTMQPLAQKWVRFHGGFAVTHLVLAAAWFRFGRPRLASPMAGALPWLALLALDLGAFNWVTNPSQPAPDQPFPATPILRWLQEQEGVRVGAEGSGTALFRIARFKSPATDFPGTTSDPMPLGPNLSMIYGIRDLQGFESLVDERMEALVSLPEPEVVVDHHVLWNYTDPAALSSPVLDLLSVKFILSPALALPGCERADLPEEWMKTERVAIHVRPNARSLLQLPQTIETVSRQEMVERMGAPSYDPDAVAFVESGEDLDVVARAENVALDARITAASVKATHWDLDFESSSPFALRVAEGWHPGWKGTVVMDDGTEAEIPCVRCDLALRLFQLPAGRGRLTIRFAPRTWIWGWVAASGAGVALVAGWWISRPGSKSHVASSMSLSE